MSSRSVQDVVIGRKPSPIKHNPNGLGEITSTEFMMRAIGRQEERNRIRTELTAWIKNQPNPATVYHDRFSDVIDRICPKE